MAGWPLVIVWRLVSLPITWAGRGLWWPAGFLLLSGGWYLCLSRGQGGGLWWPAGLLLLSGGWYLCLLRGQGGGYGGQLASCYCVEVGISGYYVGRAGVMVAGWPLVIVWRLVYLPITWAGRGGYDGGLASCYCLEVCISAYYVGRAGVMVAGWSLVIDWRLVSLPITWAGRGLWWLAGLLLLSGGWYLCLLREQGGDYGGPLASCYCLEVGISAYDVGRAGGYGGQLASCYCLEVGISAYDVGGAGDYGGRLASCYCLEVDIMFLASGCWHLCSSIKCH